MPKEELLPLYEVIPYTDVTATTIARVERLPGDLFRFVLAINQILDDGTPALVVVAKVIWPLCALPAAMRELAIIMADHPLMAENGQIMPMMLS